MSDNVCKWCGQKAVSRDIEEGLEVYGCGSSVYDDGRESQWTKCKLNVAERRIAVAIDAAKQAIRLNLGSQDEDGEEVGWEHDGVAYVLESDLNRVVDILQGSYPEIPDDSNNSPGKQEGST